MSYKEEYKCQEPYNLIIFTNTVAFDTLPHQIFTSATTFGQRFLVISKFDGIREGN